MRSFRATLELAGSAEQNFYHLHFSLPVTRAEATAVSAVRAGVLALHGRNYLIVRNAITVSLKLMAGSHVCNHSSAISVSPPVRYPPLGEGVAYTNFTAAFV